MEAWIFDMDGTLCDVSSVRHYVVGETKNFDAFHKAAVTSCPPHQWVVDAAREADARGIKVLIVSARMARWGRDSLKWATNVGVPWHDAWFRQNGDFRRDNIVKREIYHDICERGYNVTRAYDDNPSIVALWEELKVDCVVVPGWDD